MTTNKLDQEINFDNMNSCDYCNMYSNCTQTYKECRTYNPKLWKEFEKRVKQERKEIFNKMIESID